MPPPLGYFLTWSCYGTWLHGDERGLVDEDHAMPATPWLAPNPGREHVERRSMTGRAVTLNDPARNVIDETIRDHCRIKSWEVHALNVRTKHVHLVVSCPPEVSPEAAMNQLKAWCTRRLRVRGLFGPDDQIWTKHGSTRWINNIKGLDAAIEYVLERQ